jgi:ribosome-associated translation inhibitor RaiA
MALALSPSMTQRRAAFRNEIPKPSKPAIGRAGVTQTPLHVRTFGATARVGLGDYVRAKLGRKLGKFAPAIERVSVRFDDVNGPRGGVDTVSHIKVVLSQRPSVVIEAQGTDAWHAFDQASHRTERTVRRSLGRAGMTAGRGAPRRAPSSPSNGKPARAYAALPKGSLIGARVGRSRANLARTLAWSNAVDTSQPGVSATDRKAGGASTAARNVKRSTPRATAALEDSATGKPSRKSTRGSANRAKAGSKQGRRAKVRAASPKRAATKSKARGVGRSAG